MKKNLFYIVLLLVGFSSCKEEKGPMFPGDFTIIPFNVKTSSVEVKAGEPVVFQIEGNADTINFYSGEYGKDYNFIGGREEPVEDPTLKIRVNQSNNTQNSFSILLSQEFNGDYSYAGITTPTANWTDITHEFGLPVPDGTTKITDPINIGEYIADKNKPYYIALRNNLQASSAGTQTQIRFYGETATTKSFLFKGTVNGTEVDIATIQGLEWQFANTGYTGTRPAVPYWVLATTDGTPVVDLFFPRNTPSTDAMDAWAVSKAISPTVNFAGDKGALIKRISDLPREEYQYTYLTPGEYDVTFEGINVNRTRKLVQFKVIVTP